MIGYRAGIASSNNKRAVGRAATVEIAKKVRSNSGFCYKWDRPARHPWATRRFEFGHAKAGETPFGYSNVAIERVSERGVKLIRRVGRRTRLVKVWPTTFDTLAASKANKSGAAVVGTALLQARAGVLVLGDGGNTAMTRTAHPRLHPAVRWKPARLTGE